MINVLFIMYIDNSSKTTAAYDDIIKEGDN